MKLSAREDIDAPIEKVFAVIGDFETVEKAALRRGIEVQRTEDRTPPAPGMQWTAAFQFRGKPREAQITLTEYSAPEKLVYDSISSGLETQILIELVALSPVKTRVFLKTDMSPKTLGARLLIQSLKLAKGNVEKRYKARFADVARLVATRAKDVA